MLLVADLAAESIAGLIHKFGLSIERVPGGQSIKGSFWGEPEAGVAGDIVFVRGDTPIHSLLHETSHVVCMTPARRTKLQGDAGGDDLEECAVCYLQILLADELPGAGKERLMQDMDDWGYSFRLGSTRRWFEEDAADAEAWLERHGIIQTGRRPTFQLRRS
jgi:hypothetical protein